MSNEFQHKSVGSQMTQTEYEHTDGTGHIFDSQATGDIAYADSSSVLKRLGFGSTGQLLEVSSGKPAWTATLTGVTSVLNTSLVIGRDADNDIDFGTDNTILFRADGADQIKLTNGALLPVTDDDIDLGSSSLQFKDGFFDGTLEADAITVGGTAVLTGGAETAITSILNTSLVVGRDADNDIDFGTDNNIIFRAGAADQIKLIDGALAPVTDNDVDLGTSSLEFKDAFFDGTVTTDALAMATNTSGNLLIGTGSAFASTAVTDLSAISSIDDTDTFLAIDATDGALKKVARSVVVSGLATSSAISNVADDTAPHLGGDLDVQTNSIITDTGNRNIKLQVHGTGKVEVRGNTDSSGTNPGTIILNCEQNTHGQTIKAQAHSASVTNTLTLPAGGDGELLSTVATQTLTNKTLTAPKINEDVAVAATATELNIMDGNTSVGTTAVADGDGIVTNDGGTMKQTSVETFATYFASEITGMSNLTTVGTLSTLTVDNVITNGTTIGHTDDTDLLTLADGILTVAGEVSMTTLDIGGTNVTATAAELNLLDGGTSVGSSITVVDADGFVVNDGGTMKTIPASDVKTYAGISGDITLGTDEKLILDTTPSDDNGSGLIVKGTIASGVNAGETVYLNGSGEYARADKSDASTMPAVGVAMEATGSNKKILIFGVIRNAGFSLTQGEEVYQDDNGFMTTTPPGSTSGDLLQRLGVALDSTHVLFNPSLDTIEHA